MSCRSFGDRDVQSIETNDILAVLNPVWTAKPETASRVRQRIEVVLDYATALGKRERANPARWRGHLDQVLAQPNKVRAVELKPNGRTNLREQDDTDLDIADELFAGWGLIKPHRVQHDDD